jgi:hypothetical protein
MGLTREAVVGAVNLSSQERSLLRRLSSTISHSCRAEARPCGGPGRRGSRPARPEQLLDDEPREPPIVACGKRRALLPFL